MTGVVGGKMFLTPGFQQVYVCVKSEYMTVAVCYFVSLGLVLISNVFDNKIHQSWIIKSILGLCRLHFDLEKE